MTLAALVQWLHYTTIENRAAALRQRLAESRARMRGK